MVTSALRIAALVVLLATSAVLGQDDGDESEVLECYTCTMSGDNDDSCFTDPDNSGATPVTECKLGTGQCCIISRTDSTDDPGTPMSMFRGCIEDCDPDLIGKLVKTETFSTTTYESYCDEDRCNNGPGDTEPGGGGGSGSYIDGIAGVENGAAELKAARFALGLLSISLVWNML